MKLLIMVFIKLWLKTKFGSKAASKARGPCAAATLQIYLCVTYLNSMCEIKWERVELALFKLNRYLKMIKLSFLFVLFQKLKNEEFSNEFTYMN